MYLVSVNFLYLFKFCPIYDKRYKALLREVKTRKCHAVIALVLDFLVWLKQCLKFCCQ